MSRMTNTHTLWIVFFLSAMLLLLPLYADAQGFMQTMQAIKQLTVAQQGKLTDSQSAYFRKWDVIENSNALTQQDVDTLCDSLTGPIPPENKNNAYFPGYAAENCKQEHKTSNLIKDCIFKHGNLIDLAITYANGVYVKQDLNKALAYICAYDDLTSVEKISMVQTIFQAQRQGALKETFDWCHHVTSSQHISICFDQEQAHIFNRLDNQFKQLPAQFSEEQKKAYDALLESAFQFFSARAQREQDLTGSLRNVFITEWERDQKLWLADTLSSIESGKIKIQPADFQVTDTQMQLTYRKIMAEKTQAYEDYLNNKIPTIYISKEAVADTQKDFLLYREAFANFVHLRHPKIAYQHVKAWLSNIRRQQLDELSEI